MVSWTKKYNSIYNCPIHNYTGYEKKGKIILILWKIWFIEMQSSVFHEWIYIYTCGMKSLSEMRL